MEILRANFLSKALDIHMRIVAPTPAQSFPSVWQEGMAAACVLGLGFYLLPIMGSILSACDYQPRSIFLV